MKPERWQQIKGILQSALEHTPRERAAFLDQACADPVLRVEVESLIASHEQAEGFIESPAFEVMAGSLADNESVIGRSLGTYEVIARLGAGGMGEVYLAEDTRLGRKVALKMLPAYLTTEDERVRRFQQEARAASALNHPNIITIYEIGEIDSRHFMATEFIDGETLFDRLRSGLMKISDAVDVAVQVTSALCSAHQAGIVHRDIKPGNIMLRTDGIAKVLDFGLATLTEHKSDDLEAATLIKTKQGIVMGTAHYMSPEQARGQKMDARTDIFSLGVVLYEMVTGRVPFRGQTMTDVLASILMLEAPSLSQAAPEAPEELQRIVHRALRKDKEERYKTAGELLSDLKTLKQELEFETRRGGYLSRASGASAAVVAKARPETRYARSGDVNIAYQVLGDGPVDLVYVPGWVTNIDYSWEEPSLARYYRRLASFSRLILFDKRGTGLSDQTAKLPTLEQRMDDVRAVMDAVGSKRAALFGASEGGNMCILFAATYPERTTALVTVGIYANRIWHPEYPWAPTPEARQKWYDQLEQEWGGVVDLPVLAPSVANDERFKQWWASFLRLSASPGAALALGQTNTQIDVRHVLPAIRVPTLVLHRTGDLDVNVEEGRFIAARIPGAKFVEFPGRDHLPWVGDQNAILDEVEEFLKGIQQVPDLDRVLATVLFTHTVGPTAVTAKLRPHQWQDVLGRHYQLVRRELKQFRGHEVELTENRLLATFDGPARAIRAACAVNDSARLLGIEITAGLHTGECDVIGDKVGGVAVEIGAEVAAKATAGEILVSSTVKDLVSGSGIEFEDRGAHILNRVTGKWQLFAVKQDKDSGPVTKALPASKTKVGAPALTDSASRSVPLEQEIRFCTTGDGVRIAYATVGQGAPLLKAANWLNHLEFDWHSPIWRHLIQEFGRDHFLVRYDERGNGLSDWDVENFTFEAFVQDLASVVDSLGLDRFPILGISQGGPVAIAYAVRHPERVSHLILYGAYARGWANRGVPEVIERWQIQKSLIKLGWGQDNPAFRQLWSTLYIPDASPEQWQWFNDLHRVSTSPENALRLFEELGKIDVVDLLKQVKVPTLVLHCRDEVVVPFEEGRTLAGLIPGARFVPLEGRNHLLLESEPAWPKFVTEVRRFLGTTR